METEERHEIKKETKEVFLIKHKYRSALKISNVESLDCVRGVMMVQMS